MTSDGAVLRPLAFGAGRGLVVCKLCALMQKRGGSGSKEELLSDVRAAAARLACNVLQAISNAGSAGPHCLPSSALWRAPPPADAVAVAATAAWQKRLGATQWLGHRSRRQHQPSEKRIRKCAEPCERGLRFFIAIALAGGGGARAREKKPFLYGGGARWPPTASLRRVVCPSVRSSGSSR